MSVRGTAHGFSVSIVLPRRQRRRLRDQPTCRPRHNGQIAAPMIAHGTMFSAGNGGPRNRARQWLGRRLLSCGAVRANGRCKRSCRCCVPPCTAACVLLHAALPPKTQTGCVSCAGSRPLAGGLLEARGAIRCRGVRAARCCASTLAYNRRGACVGASPPDASCLAQAAWRKLPDACGYLWPRSSLRLPSPVACDDGLMFVEPRSLLAAAARSLGIRDGPARVHPSTNRAVEPPCGVLVDR